MKISAEWLGQYLDLSDLSSDELENYITTKVAEVDEIERVAVGVDDAVVAEITKVAPHPEKSGLQLATVSTGKDQLEVICGAPNCRVGLRTAYLAPGANWYRTRTLEGGLGKVEKKSIGGVESLGMLASAAELGLTNNHDGVIELEASAKPGAALASVVGASDVVFEIDNKSLTHRPDLWCHFGFARELAAILDRELRDDIDRFGDDTADGRALLEQLSSVKCNYSIHIDADTEVRRFSGFELTGVSAGESPLWLERRLYSIGAGLRNFLVDLSNYVMHDVGQPNHTYDADKLTGQKIFIRRAKAGEKFLGLDEVERTLSDEDVVIADTAGPISLGGVIGGGPSSISETTTRVFLECANFDPVRVRKTCHRHQLRTDASNRFEKSRSAHSVPFSLQRYIEILTQVQPGASVAAGLSEDFPVRPKAVSVSTSNAFIRERLGAEVADEQILGILRGLRFGIEGDTSGEYTVSVPHFRATRDISIAEDLVEEVGRIFGYENVPERAPLIESTAPARDALRALEHSLRDHFSGNGFYEISHYSFQNQALTEQLGYSIQGAIELQNKISADEGFLRTTLVAGMVESLQKNARYEEQIALFELGRSYHSLEKKVDTRPARERRLLSLGYTSGVSEDASNRGLNFHTLASLVRSALYRASGQRLRLLPFEDSAKPQGEGTFSLRTWMHPYRQAGMYLGDALVGVIAEVRPGAVEDLPERPVIAEFDCEAVLAAVGEEALFTSIAKYPDSLFELSVVMPSKEPYAKLEDLLRGSVAPEVLRNIEFLSAYEGSPLAQGEKSVSVKFAFGRKDRTLSGEELSSIQDGVIAAVDSSSYALRS